MPVIGMLPGRPAMIGKDLKRYCGRALSAGATGVRVTDGRS
jgi:hypothetical protein